MSHEDENIALYRDRLSDLVKAKEKEGEEGDEKNEAAENTEQPEGDEEGEEKGEKKYMKSNPFKEAGKELMKDHKEPDADNFGGKSDNDEDNKPGKKFMKHKEPDADEKGGKSDEDADDKYDDKFMKKMKKYMKENPEEFKSMEKAKANLETAADEMGELEGVDSVLVNGTDMVKAFIGLSNDLVKALSDLSDRVAGIEEKIDESQELAKASGMVLLDAAQKIDRTASEPLPKKSSMMAKAETSSQVLDVRKIKGMLLKKATEEDDKFAAKLLTQVECAGGQLSRLPQDSQTYLKNLL